MGSVSQHSRELSLEQIQPLLEAAPEVRSRAKGGGGVRVDQPDAKATILGDNGTEPDAGDAEGGAVQANTCSLRRPGPLEFASIHRCVRLGEIYHRADTRSRVT